MRATRIFSSFPLSLLMVFPLLILSSADVWAQSIQSFELAGHTIQIEGEIGDFQIEITNHKVSEGLEIATLSLSHPSGGVPPQLALKWKLPSNNIAGYWSSASFTKKTINPDWWPSRVKSMLAREAPMMTLFGHNDINRSTFAVSDALNTVETSVGVREEDGMIYNQILLFSEVHKEITSYEIQLRIDDREIPYSKAIQEVAEWWASFEAYKPLQVPEVARLPVYSTWYSYHQNVSSEALLEECRLAKKMGFKSIIVDDGWQTLDGNRGYAFTGDWEPERLTDMKELVEQVHDIGMKFVLWYAVPFVGENSKSYEQMKGKFLRYWDGQGAYVLDPRFPEVRDFIIDTYVKAVKDWDLDGFKLDFIARFSADKNTVLEATDGRDYASVNEATDVLMTQLVQKLQEIKPDIMIEFRQPYSGPAMRKYGNMFRAADCPNLSMINRVRTTDLRLQSGSTAVHSDMLMWHYDELVETAALQLVNVLFSVPQISVRLEDIPEDHFKMIRFYLDYWMIHRSILLDGEFHAANPLANYTSISGWDEEKKIILLSDDIVATVNTENFKEFDLINAKASSTVVIEVEGTEQAFSYSIISCLGEEVKVGQLILKKGVYAFEVPPSGLISFFRLD